MVAPSARFLRRTTTQSPLSFQGEFQKGDECFEVAFGMPRSYEQFMAKATGRGHPSNFCKMVPEDLQETIRFHNEHTYAEISQYRLAWCKRWLKRAAELDRDEKFEAAERHPSTEKRG